jgi:NAD(P)-dependent dehydrogenase (short-subunit alcohol dehydrogenase family)
VTAVDKDPQALRTEPCQALEGDLGADNLVHLVDDLTRNGPIELIVNNVGITTRHGFLDIEPPEFDEVLSTNLRGPWFFTRRLVDVLLDSMRRDAYQWRPRRGSIVFLSSLHDHVVAGQPHYSTSKAAVTMLTRELARELGRHRIRVNAISPGWIRTAVDPGASGEVRPPVAADPPRHGGRSRRRRQGRDLPAERCLVGLHHRPEHRGGRWALAAQLGGRVAGQAEPRLAGHCQ